MSIKKTQQKINKVSTKTMDYKRNPNCNWKKKDSCVGSNKIFYINNIKHIETASQLY